MLIIMTVCVSVCFEVSIAVSSLVVSGGVVSDGFLQVCPGTTVSLTCSHDSTSDATRWVITLPLQSDCNTIITHTNTPNSEAMCGLFDVTMISAVGETTRTSTLELVVTTSLSNRVVTCYAGASTSDPQAGNYTVQVLDPPSTPTTGSIMYSVTDTTTGQVTFEASSSGSFGIGVSYLGSVVGGGGSLSVDGNRFTVTGLSYTESHTVNVVATSVMCPGVLNSSSSDIVVNFNIQRPVVSLPPGSIDCTNPSLPISGSWTVETRVLSTSDLAVPLTPPPIGTPTITYTTAGGRSGSAEFVADSSYQLTDTVKNDVYTFTVIVTNAAGATSEVSAGVTVTPYLVNESSLSGGCLMFSLGSNCATPEIENFIIRFERGSGVCRDLRPSDFASTDVPLTSQSTCVPVVSSTNLCYRANLLYNGVIIDTKSNINLNSCPVSDLELFLTSDVSSQLDGEVTNGNVSHSTTASLHCDGTFTSVSGGVDVVICVDGQWDNTAIRWCSTSSTELVALTFVLTFVLTLVVGVSIGVLGVLAVIKCRRSERITLQTETEMIQPPVIYEEPDDIKPDPQTQGNMAYGNVQFRQ